ncbi:MAG: rRNA maturation RNase YbeY [Bacteroidetes bacterium]|nr:rRNA maturation RNase YbeY [Bacteroidota bacterium]
MVKNVHIYSSYDYQINKIQIHKLVFFLKKKLNISINSLEINFISSNEIHKLNNKHLGHNYTTDILTFNYTGNNKKLDGEIFISFTNAFENSKIFNVSSKIELFRLVIHGILHLIGLDDIIEKDKIIMKEREDLLLNNFCKLF